ncbi:hypothetical protein QE401_001523 [Pseudoroseomonas cervicalis]|nr:hypothetical protein [Pseudoroseomonas cervicalis]
MRSLTSSRISRSTTGRKIAPEAPGVEAVAAAHLQHVTEAARGDQPDLRALALQQRIGADGGAMHHGGELRHGAEALQPFQETHRLIAAVGWHLGGAEASRRLVIAEEIGEGAADIDANNGRAHAAPFSVT